LPSLLEHPNYVKPFRLAVEGAHSNFPIGGSKRIGNIPADFSPNRVKNSGTAEKLQEPL
jgi:hypothetical protein